MKRSRYDACMRILWWILILAVLAGAIGHLLLLALGVTPSEFR